MPHSTLDDNAMPSPRQASEDEIMPDAPAPKDENVEKPTDLAHAVEAQKEEVKLEDLFNDDDSEDEEFPSSSIPDTKIESSPPAAPV